MNKEKIQATMNRLDLGRFPLQVKLSLKEDLGLTYVGAALQTPDVDDPSKGPRDGIWPAHSVLLTNDSENEVIWATREAIVRALSHEIDEHLKFDGLRIINPHPVTP